MLSPERAGSLLGLAYLLALAAGSFLVSRNEPGWRRPPAREWRAAADLPRHHQISPSDLLPPDPRTRPEAASPLIGRHLLAAKARNAKIDSTDVAMLPRLVDAPRPGTIRFLHRPGAAESGLFSVYQPGVRASACIWPDSAGVVGARPYTCSARFTVAAVHRSTAPGDSGWILLEADSATAVSFLRSPRRILLQGSVSQVR